MGRQRIANNQWVSGALIVILAGLIFFAPSYGWKVRSFLSPQPQASAAPAAGITQDNGEVASLTAENDALKAQLAEFQAIQAELPSSTPNAIRAMVYSRYPMNFKNELLVSAGTREGVAAGAAVTYDGMLVGQVTKAYPDSAVVQTIFDDGMKMPVRIGAQGYNGLLQGGAAPMVGSIAATDTVAPGDIVYSAASGMPYALPIAEVTATSTSPDSLFEQASINIPYDINNVETVLVMQ